MNKTMDRLLETAYAPFAGNSEIEHFRVSFEHAACSYGQPVLVIAPPHSDGRAFGPADVGTVQCNGRHAEALRSAGFKFAE